MKKIRLKNSSIFASSGKLDTVNESSEQEDTHISKLRSGGSDETAHSDSEEEDPYDVHNYGR